MTDEQETQAAIRTPDQRLRVFVSSTLVELADERAAVARAITALGLTPVLFELGARPHPPRELYRAYLAQSEIFIGLYWQRYGWIGPDMDISGLEDEFRLSHAHARLLYVKSPAPEREPRLAAMIQQLQSDGTDSYRTFRTPRELGRLVRADLALLLSERFATGRRPVDASKSSAAATDRRLGGLAALPVAATSLIGRESAIAEVSALLRAPDARLVTLTGPGGIGKTRLATAVAAIIAPEYDRRVLFVPLVSLDRAELVLPRIATAVGAQLDGARPALEVLIEHFADTSALLVLDNLEHVVGAAPELDALLSGCPGLRILATSRTALRLRAEREYSVAALVVPDFADPPALAEVASLPAVHLFVDRAKAVRFEFELTDGTLSAVLEICRRLDGLPLALELAAARIRLLDPAALLARLGSTLDSLGAGPVDLPARQRTMRATVEWSVGLLDEDERMMLAMMSAFVDGWSLDAAVAVADIGDDRALDLLDALARHSLVTVEATAAHPRFRMLTSVRDYAAEVLVAHEAHDGVRRRHAEYFRSIVDDAEWPAERQAAWAERIRVDEENLRVAIRWFLDHDISPLPHMFRVLWLFWQMRGRVPEARAWIDEVQQAANTLDERGRIELLFTSAVTAVEVGDDDSALAALDELRRRQGHIGDPYLECGIQLALSWILPILDDLDGALVAATAAFDGFRDQNEPSRAFAALTLGIVDMTLGRDESARAMLKEADDLGCRLDNGWLRRTSRSQLALLAARAGHVDEARTLLARSVEVSGGTDLSVLTLAFSLLACAELALVQDDPRRAAMAFGAADGLRQRAGLRAWPSMRRLEADLLARVRAANDDEAPFHAGALLTRGEAVALVRGESQHV